MMVFLKTLKWLADFYWTRENEEIFYFFKITGFHNLLQFTFQFKLLLQYFTISQVQLGYSTTPWHNNSIAKGILRKFIFQECFLNTALLHNLGNTRMMQKQAVWQLKYLLVVQKGVAGITISSYSFNYSLKNWKDTKNLKSQVTFSIKRSTLLKNKTNI